MTILTVRHVTTYRYRRPVALGDHRMMFRPRDSYDQRLIESRLVITPEPVRMHWIHDPFGNCVAIARFKARASELRFESTIRVDHYPDNVPDFQTDPRAKAYPFVYDSQEMPDLMASIARGYPDPNGEIDHWVRKFLLPGRPTPTGKLLMTLTHAIKEGFTYTRRAEHGTQEPVLNGILWVLRSGAPWRDLPDSFGPYTTCYNRFVRWRRAGVWAGIMNALAAAHDASVQMIDTSIVRVHQHGACIIRNRRQSMGRSRGGLTSKIHALVDTNGLPVRLAVTAGEAHDNRLADKLLSRLKPGSMLLADRGYDADWIRVLSAKRGAWANIPPRCNRNEPICFSPYLYRARNLVERFFNRIKHCRRIATRYDKLAANYLAFVQLASIRLWLRVNESTS